jgi:hypothetical protein
MRNLCASFDVFRDSHILPAHNSEAGRALASRETSPFTQKSHSRKIASGGCTIFRHLAVDELHSIENRRDRVATNLLTSPLGGVKPESFFDSFGSSKSRSELQLTRQRWLHRQAEDSNEPPRAHGARQRTREIASCRRRAETVRGKTESRDVNGVPAGGKSGKASFEQQVRCASVRQASSSKDYDVTPLAEESRSTTARDFLFVLCETPLRRYSGIFPCFFGGFLSRLFSNISRA